MGSPRGGMSADETLTWGVFLSSPEEPLPKSSSETVGAGAVRSTDHRTVGMVVFVLVVYEYK